MNEKETRYVNEGALTIEYTQPKFWHRVMANFVDIFIMAVMFIGLFVGVRAIVQATPSYNNTMNKLNAMKLESGLYVNDSSATGKITDIITYEEKYNQLYGREYVVGPEDEPIGRNGICVKAINKFINYCHENCSEERYHDIVTYYAQARLDPTYNDIHFFIQDGENIIPNEVLSEDGSKASAYYSQVFKPFIEKKCLPFLVANVPEYRKLSKMDYVYLLAVELPIAYVLAGILTYFVPPLFFKRGRKTLGKALYHIGLIDTRLLSPTFPRFLARFAIFLFLELILSLFSFGIPYIISFSMMVFSKKRQGFPDYMVRLREIDTSKANIYMDYVEATLKNELHGQAIDFKMEKPL